MSAAERHAELSAALFEETAEEGEADADVVVVVSAPPPPDESWIASTAVARLAMRLAATTRRISLARMSFASLYPCFLLFPPPPASPGKPSSRSPSGPAGCRTSRRSPFDGLRLRTSGSWLPLVGGLSDRAPRPRGP